MRRSGVKVQWAALMVLRRQGAPMHITAALSVRRRGLSRGVCFNTPRRDVATSTSHQYCSANH